MPLKNSLKKIKELILKRYGKNLVAILVFGSANTGHFREGKSDIDTMIFLKRLNGLNLKKETKFLINKLKAENFHTQYFFTINEIKKYAKKRISWSTRITILTEDGSRVLYSTEEFEKLKKWLIKNFPTKEEIREYVREKDKFELEGYFKKIKNFELTKGLFSNIRRKLQITYYFQKQNLVFDYNKCLDKISLPNKEKERLQLLYKLYNERKKLSKKQIKDYYFLAKNFTNKILRN